MKWIKAPHKGQETLYIEGANGNKLKGHGTGLAGVVTVNLDPKGSLAMKNNRHPITDAGVESLLKKIGGNLRKGLQAGEFTSKEHGEQVVYRRKIARIEGIFPKDESKGYYCYRCVVNLDIEKKVPIRIEIFDWDDQLAERYSYENLDLNAGLADKDFDSRNPEYNF